MKYYILAVFFTLIGINSTSFMTASSDETCNSPHTIFVPRSQGCNLARAYAGLDCHIHKFDVQDNYVTLVLTPEYSQSRKSQHISNYLFGCLAPCGELHFSGSSALQRGNCDLLADYFGLPTDFKSIITLDPIIRNFILNFHAFVGLDSWIEGLYLSIQAPLTYTSWGLRPEEQVTTPGANDYINGYMTKGTVPDANLQKRALDALAGGAVFGDMQTPLHYGKISCHKRSKTAIADLRTTFGYHVLCSDDGYLSIELPIVFPTGNSPCPDFLFDPVAGNGRHYEVGFGLSARSTICEWHEESYTAFTWDFVITHLFANTQNRSFDFTKNGAGSRYMLLVQHQPIPIDQSGQVENGHINNGGLTVEYAGSLVPAINIVTLASKVRINYQIDTTFKLTYRCDGLVFDLGYNLWARAAECVRLCGSLCENTYTIKGDAYLYGMPRRLTDGVTPVPGGVVGGGQANYPGNAIALALSEQQATVLSGTNYNSCFNTTNVPGELNPQVDYREFAEARFANSDVPLDTPNGAQATPTDPDSRRISTSNPPLFIRTCDLNIASGTAPRAMSHKVFAHLNYTFDHIFSRSSCFCNLCFFVGLGGEIEFNGSSPCGCASALDQWGIWGTVGVSF